MKWSVCDRFHEYLYGGKFKAFTDNNPLTYILTTAKLDATGQRWVANLANYTVSIKFKSGKSNVDADVLSRNPWDMQVDSAIVNSIIKEEGLTQTPFYESYGPNTDLLHSEVVIAKGGYVTGIVPPELEMTKASTTSREDWIAAQKQDPVLNQLITTLGHRKHHTNDSPELKSMLRIKNQLILRKGLLFRKMRMGNQEGSILEFVVPKKFRTKVLRACY